MPISRLSEAAPQGDLAAVIALVRSGAVRTRPDLARLSGLGRKAVTHRVEQLIAGGPFEDGVLGRSTGGRSPCELLFRAEAGCVLACELNSAVITVGLVDLSGRLLIHREEPADVHARADVTLSHIEQVFDQVLRDAERRATDAERTSPILWGIGMYTVRSMRRPDGLWRSAPPFRGWWGDYPVRDRVEARYRVPVWPDNDGVNLMALGELRGGLGRGHQDVVYLKPGHGFGAGLISGGRLHRGAHGIAGEVGHIAVSDDPSATCPCGNLGCLNAVAGGYALARAGTEAGHKIDLYRACEDMFDAVDRLARMLGEVSCLCTRDGQVIAHAKDPVSAGLAIEALLEPGQWTRTGAEAFLLGAGGAAVAISWHGSSRSSTRPGPQAMSGSRTAGCTSCTAGPGRSPRSSM